MAFDRKYAALMSLKPDVAIVPECATPEILAKKAPGFQPSAALWVGENKDKGLAVFAFNDLKLSLASDFEPSLKYILPAKVTGPVEFDLLAIWAFMSGKYMKDRRDIGPVNKAIARYERKLASGRAIIAGDFNNHLKWDRRGNPRNFGIVTEKLNQLGMASAYHYARNLSHGDETEQTHYWRDRREFSPYNCHIDYLFLPSTFLKKMKQFEIGNYGDWCGNKLSDHVPLLVDVAP